MTTKDEIKQILEYRRFFFLALDKKTSPASKYSFSTPQKLKPLFSDITKRDGTHATCLRVCLNEQTAYYDEEINKSYYSKITSSELERLCKISEAETSLMINFVIAGKNIAEFPIKASEVFDILSKRTVFSSLKNFYKSHTGKMYIAEDIFLFIFFIIFYIGFVLKPRSEAKFAQESLEKRRQTALETGFKEVMDYDYQGRMFHKSTITAGESYAYDENERLSGKIYTKRLTDKYYEYDEAGNLILEREVFTETTEQKKWLEESSDCKSTDGTIEVRYKYDKKGNLISSESTDGKKNLYKYDKEGRLVSMKTESGFESVYEYGEDGNLSLIKNSTGTTEEYRYFEDKLSSRKLKNEKGWDICNFYYEYDENGNLVEFSAIDRQDSRNKSLHRNWTYEYNSDGLKNFEKLENITMNWEKNGGIK